MATVSSVSQNEHFLRNGLTFFPAVWANSSYILKLTIICANAVVLSVAHGYGKTTACSSTAALYVGPRRAHLAVFIKTAVTTRHTASWLKTIFIVIFAIDGSLTIQYTTNSKLSSKLGNVTPIENVYLLVLNVGSIEVVKSTDLWNNLEGSQKNENWLR